MEIIEEMMGKMRDYSTGSDYQPLSVELQVGSPIYLTSPYLNLDSIILYLCTRDALGDLFYIMPSDVTLDTSVIDIPFKKTGDVPHCSIAQLEKNALKKDTIYKRFTDKETYHLTKRQRKGRVKTNQGHFKDFMIDLPVLITKNLKFYCNADKRELERLLPFIKNIGKKSSIGGGRITGFSVKEESEDYSFYKEGKIMRPVPSDMKLPIVEGMVFRREAYKPPYWNKDNVTFCVVPESEIQL